MRIILWKVNGMTNPTTRIATAPMGAEDPQLKVLLVHGIGTQAAGSHLVDSVEAIVELLVKSGHLADVESAALVDGPTNGTPAHAQVKVGEGQSWLFAEAHWADTFPSPSYRELLWWGFKVAPITAIVYAAGVVTSAARNVPVAWHRSGESIGAGGRLWALLLVMSAIVQLAVVPLVLPLLLVVMVLLLIVALIPLSAVRSGVLSIQRALTGSLGDCYVFSWLPVRRAAILTAVREDLRWLRESPGDAPVVVIAHSQGAAVAYNVLLQEEQQVPLLLTYGSGLERLSLARRAFAGGWVFTGYSLLALLGAGMMTWFSTGLVHSIASSPIAWGACLGTFLGAAFVSSALAARVQAPKSEQLKDARYVVALLIMAVGILGSMTGAWILHPGIVGWWTGGFLLVGALILASSLAKGDEHPVPAAVGRWVDLQADADPVPSAGPSQTAKGKSREVVRFTLTGSIFRDHVSYWKHPDVFTWRVIAEFDMVASPNDDVIRSALAERGREAGKSRTWLVCARTLVLWALLGAAAAVVAGRWEWFNPGIRTWSDDLVSAVSDAVGLPAIAEGYAGSALSVVVVMLAFVLTYQVVLVPWRCWNLAHLRRFHSDVGASWARPLALLTMVLTVAAVGIGTGIAVLPFDAVVDVAGQAAPLLWLGVAWMSCSIVVGWWRSSGVDDASARIGRGIAWGLVFTSVVWTGTFAVLLPVHVQLGDAVQQMQAFEQRKMIILLVLGAALAVWSVAVLVKKAPTLQ